MRILLEIDGMPAAATAGADATGGTLVAAGRDDAPVDGGGGPGGATTRNKTADTAVVTDSGPPPDWLLEAVTAAEAQGRRTGPATAGNAVNDPSDAGSAPDA